MKQIEHWVDGKSTTGSGTRTGPVFNPATGEQTGVVVFAAAEDVDAAVRSATAAFEQWSQTSLAARTKILFEFRRLVADHMDELARIICEEHGKVLADARGEVQRGLEVVELACGIPTLLKGDYSDQVSTGVDAFSFRQPLGVVAGITPFNFPVMVPMWMHPIAIACGNAFILKPSERDPSASQMVARLWQEAGLPDGVFTVINGDREAVDALLDHPGIAAISFVGSTPVARYVHARATAAGKRVQALGGAKNHAVVLPDVDPGYAAEHVAAAAFGSAGERCMAISVAVAVGDGQVVDAITEEARKIRVGPGWEPESQMGPVITAAAKERITGLVNRGVEQGARLLVDGRSHVVPGYEKGFFLGPTVLDEVTPAMDVYREEIFGPVLSVVRVGTIDEAIRLVNANPYGNGAAIFTSSGAAARRFQREVTAGMIGINVPIPTPMAYYSFGGWKDSLFGERHVHGPEGVAFYTRLKAVTSRWPQVEAAQQASFHFPTAT
ncbi:methylmalonate-semialdehyde dehydrogenase (acylating) [Acidothermus cellulolyticus 11B]|uniref:methylmalonate-semialdehyde dehydrogenase (CoA acylating) n=1 Tax=Acidothermus cellulolyticus (strain ATCC 43068 / DSM 8971 / 11B) TaxID=351607 RepID=A0LVW1_ACIC1|nr:CoA-acylating methylmalonate-semialdehyde dehydrogenase [Acidothermus cellulolyticus]ABK53571.1 methylmalonate-semialdehyde dehydrogenase (acylating) [Acidothermus cellulolyticus 11B]